MPKFKEYGGKQKIHSLKYATVESIEYLLVYFSKIYSAPFSGSCRGYFRNDRHYNF